MYMKIEPEAPDGIEIKGEEAIIWGFPSLRAADAKADYDFFKQLSDEVVINIGILSTQEAGGVSLSALKSYMFLNYQVLTKVIKVLHSKQLVVLYQCSGVERVEHIAPDNIILKLTAEGSVYVRSVLHTKCKRLGIN